MSAVLEAERVFKKFGQTPALQNCSLTLESGIIVGILGPNGAGKSTLLRCLAGLIRPSQGTVWFCGVELGRKERPRIAYMADHTLLPRSLWVKEACAYYRGLFPSLDWERVRTEINRHRIPWDSRIAELPEGLTERLDLILRLARRAEVYLLDEPLGGVDPVARGAILREILGSMDGERTVVMATHLVHDIEPVLDQVVFLDHGRVVLHQGAEQLRETYGRSVEEHYMAVFERREGR